MPRLARIAASAIAFVVGLAILGSPGSALADDDVEPSTPFLDAVKEPPHWTVGVVLERGTHALVNDSLVDNQLFGLSVTRYLGQRFGVTTRLMLSPNTQQFINTRGVFALGLRTRARILGVETFFGVGAHIEARLRNHYWVMYLTPGELGVTLWQRNSFRVEVYAGPRAIVAGRLIDHFLIDPNGVNNDEARNGLTLEKRRPWEAFISLVIGRAL